MSVGFESFFLVHPSIGLCPNKTFYQSLDLKCRRFGVVHAAAWKSSDTLTLPPMTNLSTAQHVQNTGYQWTHHLANFSIQPPGSRTSQEILPESGRPGGNTLIARMNRGSLAVHKRYSVHPSWPPKYSHQNSSPWSAQALLRLFIRVDSNRKKECTSMYMGVSPAPNHNKDGSRRVFSGSLTSSPPLESGYSTTIPFDAVKTSSKGQRLKFSWNDLQRVKCWWDPAIPSYPWRLYCVFIVLYSPHWHSALLVSFPSDLSTLDFLVSCIPMFIDMYTYIMYPFVWFMFYIFLQFYHVPSPSRWSWSYLVDTGSPKNILSFKTWNDPQLLGPSWPSLLLVWSHGLSSPTIQYDS